jgi:hypothetical protein
MAQEDYSWWGGDDEFSGEQDDSERLRDVLFGNDLDMDMHAQTLFVEAVFDKNEQSYNELVDYLWFEHGIDFELAFDWADFREWYG